MADATIDTTQQLPGSLSFADSSGNPVPGLPAGVALNSSDPNLTVTLNADATFLLVPVAAAPGVVVTLVNADGTQLDAKTVDVTEPAPPPPPPPAGVATGTITLGTAEPQPGQPVPPTPAP